MDAMIRITKRISPCTFLEHSQAEEIARTKARKWERTFWEK